MNPIWFQNKCRYTFEVLPGDQPGFIVGTESAEHRQVWLNALTPSALSERISQSWVDRVDNNSKRAYRYNIMTHEVEWV